MSKSKYNVVNPDDIVISMAPTHFECGYFWDHRAGKTVEHRWFGVYGFLNKFWRLFHEKEQFLVSAEPPSSEMLKSLHATIEKSLSFNTAVSTFMICVNTAAKCNHRDILKPLTVLLAPCNICEELWKNWDTIDFKRTISHCWSHTFKETQITYPIVLMVKCLDGGGLQRGGWTSSRGQRTAQYLDGKIIRDRCSSIVNIVFWWSTKMKSLIDCCCLHDAFSLRSLRFEN